MGIIRISGKDSLPIVNRLIGGRIGARDVRRAIIAEMVGADSGETIDKVVVTYFRAPASYTGEDVVEISCHCNPLIIEKIINEGVKLGARVAQPGEFTLRAFLNQKMDLSQAEAVAEVIQSRTRQSLSQSMRHLEGKLSQRVQQIKKEIIDYLSLLEISLDFSEEDIEVMPSEELSRQIKSTIRKISELLRTYEYGRLLREGIKLLILGKPNVGKSSLLNLLLGRDRAIVSEIPGTTRDYIEASLEIDGILVQAVDTAGVRETQDRVEAIGVQRTLEQLMTADVALGMFEGHQTFSRDDHALMRVIDENRGKIKFVLILNKIDLGFREENLKSLKKYNLPLIQMSVKHEQGIRELKQKIKEQVITNESLETEELVITSERHKQVLEKTITALGNALEAVRLNSGEEVVAVDLRMALDSLGEITGETTSEDILNNIFSNFCVGK